VTFTLTAGIDAGVSSFPMSGSPTFIVRPFLAQVEAEQVLVLAAGGTIWGPVKRAQNGTSASAHALGAVVTPLFEVTSAGAPGAVPSAGSSVVVTAEATFTENGAGTYTGTVAIPAGATVLDVSFRNSVVWAAATSAAMTCGDDDAATGYFTSTNVKTTPAADTNGAGAGLSTALSLGASAGAYKGGAGKYCATAKTITCTIVSVGAGTAGRSRLLVKYALPVVSAASQA
jgi:hypothetical protein